MIINPHPNIPHPIAGPFSNAFQVPVLDLMSGIDIELPFVSSALQVVGSGMLTLKFLGGSPGSEAGPEVLTSLVGDGSALIPFRVTKFITSYVPDGAFVYADVEDPVAFVQQGLLFSSIISLW
ncbi:hypothetical protein [Hyphomicrobium sp. MC1]|uniref:hypothetical protein n=1 Tax=Hyphomicrobium sp. (strain MC1) TaxID=717785 RepID=UPI000213EB23|nr:hypothetical protein [Hyphomicrobium sp. MC1]CCB65390.1 protein of unknown function [Hyphomicrobium sp. MC1]